MTKSKKLLIASSSFDEAITQVLLKHRRTFDIPIEHILIQTLLSDYSIQDDISDDATIIHWFKPDGELISNQTHELLNRTLEVSDDLFLKFHPKDREYAKREFEAYLGHSFSAFKGIGNQTVNGLLATPYSLPEQWQALQNIKQRTPQYYWGPKHLCNIEKNLVFSNIYNLYEWRINTPKPHETHLFCFERPEGLPVFILSLGKEALFSATAPLSSNTKAMLLKRLTQIRDIFGYFIFETLVFVQNHDICFGCVNLNITHTAKHPDFELFVRQHFMRAYLTCRH